MASRTLQDWRRWNKTLRSPFLNSPFTASLRFWRNPNAIQYRCWKRTRIEAVPGRAPLQERSRKPTHGDRPRRGAAKRRWKSRSWRRTTAQYGEPAGVGTAAGDWLPGGVLAGRGRRANPGLIGVVDAGGGAANVLPRRIGT